MTSGQASEDNETDGTQAEPVPGYTPRVRARADADPELAAGLDSRLLRWHRLKALFYMWTNYRDADTPVAAAHALSVFDTAMWHYRTQLEVEGILEPETDDA